MRQPWSATLSSQHSEADKRQKMEVSVHDQRKAFI